MTCVGARSCLREPLNCQGSGKTVPVLPWGSAAATREELSVVWKRARLLRLAISLAMASVLGVVCTVFGLFLHLLAGLQVVPLVLGLFWISLAALASSLVAFLSDMTLSLHALEHEIKQAGVSDPK